jgi:hypothetical protein
MAVEIIVHSGVDAPSSRGALHLSTSAGALPYIAK